MPPKKHRKGTEVPSDQTGHENDTLGGVDEEETFSRQETTIINFSEKMLFECLGCSLAPLIDTLAPWHHRGDRLLISPGIHKKTS